MAEDHELYNMVLKGFWMDIGQPKVFLLFYGYYQDYIAGTALYLSYIREQTENVNDSHFATGEGIEGNVLVVSDK